MPVSTGLYLRVSIVCGILVGFLCYILLFAAPFSFPSGYLLKVSSGETGHDIARTLKEDKAIKSEFVFRVLLRLYGADTGVRSGTYYFPESKNSFALAWRLHMGNFNIEPVHVTIPEGLNVRQINEVLIREVPGFDSETFLIKATPKEGYLFPDTYFLYPGETTDEIIKLMLENFDTKVMQPSVRQAITASKRPMNDLVIMASLLEKEAPDTQNRAMIASILWKRLSMDMPLQVDAVFPYITGKNGADILQSDYAIDSPYNTYKYKGLPPGPISNPSLDAIIAAASATTTPYLYYLSDKNGKFYYSKTFDQHLQNQKKYLP